MFDGSSGINIHGGNFTAVAGDQITYHNQIFTISGQQLKEKDKWIEGLYFSLFKTLSSLN